MGDEAPSPVCPLAAPEPRRLHFYSGGLSRCAFSFSLCPNRHPARPDLAPAESDATLTPTGAISDASSFAPSSRARSTPAASNNTSPLRPNSNWTEISVSAAEPAALIAVRHRSIPAPARLSLGVVIRRRQSWWHAMALTVEEVQRHSNGTVERPESASTNGETQYVPIVALADASGRRGQRHRNSPSHSSEHGPEDHRTPNPDDFIFHPFVQDIAI